MLSLEEQIGRIADSAVQALDPAVSVVPAGRRGRSGRPVIVWAALAVAAAVVVVVVISNRAPNKAASSVGTVSVTTAPGGSSTVPGTLGLPDSQPVTVTGIRLPVFDDKLTSDPAVGSAAPIIKGADFQSNPVTIDGSAAGPILVVFVAPWSPHSNSEIKALVEWKRSALVPASLNVVGVVSAVSKNIGDPPASWLSGNGWDWPVMVDQSKGDGVAGVAAEAYGANGFPFMVLVGSDGKVKLRLSEEVSPIDLQQGLDKALASTVTSIQPGSVTDGIRVEGGGVVVLPSIAGFDAQPVQPTTDVAGVHGSHALYRNPATGQSFVIDELGGVTVADQLQNPETHGYQPLQDVRLMGAQAYSKTYGDPASTNSGSIEIAWQLAPDEVLLVNGQGMTVDELLAVARAVTMA